MQFVATVTEVLYARYGRWSYHLTKSWLGLSWAIVWLWAPHSKKDVKKLERSMTKMIKELEWKLYDER